MMQSGSSGDWPSQRNDSSGGSGQQIEKRQDAPALNDLHARRTDMTAKDTSGSPRGLAVTSSPDIVARAQRGEEAAFAEIFETHKRRVYSLCLRMTQNTADAEDLTQQAFLMVFRKIATFRAESTFSTWLYRLATNEVLMHLRKKRLQAVSLNEVERSREGTLAREQPQDDLQLTGTVDRITLNAAIAELPWGYRVVFLLHDVQGYEHREIAQLMSWAVGSSKSQLHRARRSLRDWFRLNDGKAPPAIPSAARKSSRNRRRRNSSWNESAVVSIVIP
jgi:RNA polymerase sigma-70 factor, ECF subfamily